VSKRPSHSVSLIYALRATNNVGHKPKKVKIAQSYCFFARHARKTAKIVQIFAIFAVLQHLRGVFEELVRFLRSEGDDTGCSRRKAVRECGTGGEMEKKNKERTCVRAFFIISY